VRGRRRATIIEQGAANIGAFIVEPVIGDMRTLPFTEDEVAQALGETSNGTVAEGAVGIGAGLVAFGFKSGVGSGD
jgi:L-aminopeptidase/D-esterase-like protein